MGLIKEISNSPRQSQGALTFDNLLLQSNPNSAAALQGSASNLNDFDKRLGAAKAGSMTKAQEVSDQIGGVRKQAADSLKSGLGNIQSSLAAREAQKDLEQQQMVSKLRYDLGALGTTPEFLSKLGVDPTSDNYGINLGDYLNYKDGADIQSVGTDEDLGRQDALKALAGNLDIGPDVLSRASPLGTTRDPYSFDLGGFNNAVQQRSGDYQKEVAAVLKELGHDASKQQDPEAFLMRNFGDKLSKEQKDRLAKYKPMKNVGSANIDRSTRGVK